MIGNAGAKGSVAEAGAGIVTSPASRAASLPESTISGGGGSKGLGSRPVAASAAPAMTTAAPVPIQAARRLTVSPVRRGG